MTWWSKHTCDVNGVFKGGGAKGVLYAGALQAMEERGHWFRAVTGASAGAITATLIGAGLDSASITELAPQGLSKIRKNYLMDLVGQPLIRTNQLQAWLEAVLIWQLAILGRPHAGAEAVTFADLNAASGIDLYVVCVDVAQKQPRVFSHELTPELSVASAVMASSAIPLAFRPGRLLVSSTGADQVHRLMDGGVWANYPAFVFRDPSFRAFHGLEPLPEESRTIGFSLDTPKATLGASGVPIAFESNSTLSGGDKGAGLRGWLRFPPLRIYLLTIAPIVLIADATWTTSHYGLLILKDNFRDSAWPGWVEGAAGFFDGFFSNFRPALWVLVTAVVLAALAMLLVGATFIDSAAPALRTLMAVGTDVPYWTGASTDDSLVRLEVPSGLSTMSFNLPMESLTLFINDARVEAGPQLDLILAEI